MFFSYFCSAFCNSGSSCAYKSTCVKTVFEAEKKTTKFKANPKKIRVEVVLFFFEISNLFF